MKKIMTVLGSMLVLFALTSCGNKANSPKDFRYHASDDGTGVIIDEYIGESAKIIIPDTIEDLPVVGVEFLANKEGTGEFFENWLGNTVEYKENRTITEVSFPDTVEYIPSFSSFTALESVKLPASLKEPDNEGHYFVEEVGTVNGNDFKAFTNNSGPSSDVKFIKSGAFNFNKCTSLKELVIPEGVTTVGDCSFSGIESVTLPSTIKAFDLGAFFKTPLAKITVPENVTKVQFSSVSYGDWTGWFFIKGSDTFKGSNLDLKSQAKLKELGYDGEF